MMLAILLLALGLAMDATAVAAARGLAAGQVSGREALRIGLYFGGLQAAMPLIGWALGLAAAGALGAFFEEVDHWVAFVILTFLGVRMIREALSDDDDDANGRTPEAFAPKVLWPLAIATSIDALAAGFTLPAMGLPVLPAVIAIGLVTGGLSTGAALMACRMGRAFGLATHRMEVAGGVVLIGLGAKILIEHLVG
jgi:putative Mn2+ efflux pump MntP